MNNMLPSQKKIGYKEENSGMGGDRTNRQLKEKRREWI